MARRGAKSRRVQPATQSSTTTEPAAPSAPGWLHLILRLVGAGLLIATGAIHLDLYLTGYRTIPTIGWLFLLQVIAAFALGLAVLAIPGRLVVPGRVAAAAGALFALSTLGGYLLSIWIGLFGFKEVSTTAGIAAGALEVAAFAVLATLALAPAWTARAARPPAGFPAQLPAAMARSGRTAAAALTIAAAVLLGIAVTSASALAASASTAAGTTLKTTVVGGTRILTNAKGLTLYSFAPDTPTTSKCNGSCATYWPPVTGTVPAGSHLPGKVGTIRRADGSLQLTYNGHPLYTYIGDSAPGQTRGNDVTLNGGLWLEVPVSK
jgi:predicted lipoprotein with Yx(FWY)xxD motif